MPVLATVERPCAIRQEVTSGNHFSASRPTSPPSFANDIFGFGVEAAGGLFDPTDGDYYAFRRPDALVLLGIELTLAGQATWKVELKGSDGSIVEVAAGTTETTYVRGSNDPPVILWGTQVLVTTAGGTPTGLTAKIKLAPYKLQQGAWYGG